MPLFGAAYAAPNIGTTILYWFSSLSTELSPTRNSRIRVLFKTFEWFSRTFQGRFNFKVFSRKPSNFKYFSSLWEPWCTCMFNRMNTVSTRPPDKSVYLKIWLFWFFKFQSTIFQLCQDRSSWIEQVLSTGLSVLLKDTMQRLRWSSNPQPLDLEPSTLPLRHCPPHLFKS